MTTISIGISENQFKIKLNGHADYNPGNDIVCAACSVLIETLIRTLEEMEHPYKSTIESGHAEVETHSKAADPYFYMAYVGYKALAEAFPENVKVIHD